MPTYPAHVTREVVFSGVVQKGDNGVKVRRVQEWLTIQGFATGVDSDFGDATEACVENFQNSKGISATGKVNQQTWNSLVEPLNKVLQPLTFPSSITLSEAILRVAKQHLAQHPVEVGGDNSGPWVRVYMGGNQGSGMRWCAGFITFVMKQACDLMSRVMPIPGSYSCDSLAYQAKQAGLFVRGTTLANGSVGWPALGVTQIFLVRHTSTDWTHTGFSFEGSGSVFSTIEGNTNDTGSANGYEVCKRTRSVPSKDFIHLP